MTWGRVLQTRGHSSHKNFEPEISSKVEKGMARAASTEGKRTKEVRDGGEGQGWGSRVLTGLATQLRFHKGKRKQLQAGGDVS